MLPSFSFKVRATLPFSVLLATTAVIIGFFNRYVFSFGKLFTFQGKLMNTLLQKCVKIVLL